MSINLTHISILNTVFEFAHRASIRISWVEKYPIFTGDCLPYDLSKQIYRKVSV